MNEERLMILQMLAEGKISVEEAEGLLSALEESTSEADDTSEEEVFSGRCYGPWPHVDWNFEHHFGQVFDPHGGEAFKMFDCCGDAFKTFGVAFKFGGPFGKKKS